MQYPMVQQTLFCLAVIVSTAAGCRPAPAAKATDSTKTPNPAEETPAPKAALDPTEASKTPPPASFERAAMSVADVSEGAVSSVVNISTRRKPPAGSGPFRSPFFSDPLLRRFFDRGPNFGQQHPERRESGIGSGVIVRTNAGGMLLTNYHVVEDADEVVVTLHDKREFPAEIVGKDPPSDLAVLKLKDPPSGLPGLPLGDSDAVRLGEVVVAIGNPFGVGQTVTMGIVSAKGRANVGIVTYEDFIQTDAAINPGNSGGALLNLRGELVGINTAILSRSGGFQGIGLAIPSNMASAIMESLVRNGRVIRGYLGVIVQPLTTDVAQAMDLEARDGALVTEVMEASPAQKAGVQAGDVIRWVDGRTIANAAKLRNLIASRGAGRTVELRILRGRKEITLSAELTEKPGEDATPEARETGSPPLSGVSVEPLTDGSRGRFRIPGRIKAGVVVTDVKRGSPAERAGLQTGDVVISADRQRVQAPADFEEAYARAEDAILLRLYRRGGFIFLVLQK